MEETLSILSTMGLRQILLGLGILFIGLLATRLVMRLVSNALDRAKGIDPSLHSMTKTLLRFVLNLAVILTVASYIGIPITSFVALLSVVSLAVSLAVQGVLGNLAGGVIILASKPFKLGDFIEADSISGTVKEIGFLYTRLLTPDGKYIFIPNSLLYASRLINYSTSAARRFDLSVSASYDNSPAEVRAAVLAAVSRFPAICQDPAPEVLLENYGDSAIQYTVRVWVDTAAFLATKYALNEALYAEFKAHGVEMTYPHMNIHMK